MAEGESEVKTIEAVTERMCEVCQDEDGLKQAVWFCKQCEQSLCEKCGSYHRKLKVSKTHELVSVKYQEANFIAETLEITSIADCHGTLCDEYRKPMCPLHNKPFEDYCREHSAPVCVSCKLVDHRKCTNFQDLGNAAAENTGLGIGALENLRTIDTFLSGIRQALEKEKNSLTKKKDRMIEEINDKIKELEHMAQKKIIEVEAMFTVESQCIEKEQEDIVHYQTIVSKQISDLNTTLKTSSEEEIFVEAERVTKAVWKFRDIIREKRILTHRQMDLSINNPAPEIFGDVTLKKKDSFVCIESQPLVFHNEIEQYDSNPIWLEIIPDGKTVILFTFYENSESHLRLYSENDTLLSQLDLPYAISADMLNDHQIIVSMYGQPTLQLVDVDKNTLTLGSCYKLKFETILISKLSDISMITMGQHKKNKFCFQILNVHGSELTNIFLKVKSLKIPTFMRSNEKTNIYVVDIVNGLFGFTISGDLIFHYKQQNRIAYLGLAVDVNGFIYMSYVGEEEKEDTEGKEKKEDTEEDTEDTEEEEEEEGTEEEDTEEEEEEEEEEVEEEKKAKEEAKEAKEDTEEEDTEEEEEDTEEEEKGVFSVIQLSSDGVFRSSLIQNARDLMYPLKCIGNKLYVVSEYKSQKTISYEDLNYL